MDLMFCSSQGIRIPFMRPLGLCVFQTLPLILKPSLLDQAFGSGTLQNGWRAEGALWNDSPRPLSHYKGSSNLLSFVLGKWNLLRNPYHMGPVSSSNKGIISLG